MPNLENLSNCPIFGHSSAEERAAFFKNLHFTVHRFLRGDFIVCQGDRINALCLLLQGSVKTEMISPAGTVLHIETIEAPYPLAAAMLFAEHNFFPVDVVALADCEVLYIDKHSLLEQFKENERFLQSFLAFTSNRAQFLSNRIQFMLLATIKGKIAHYILKQEHCNLSFQLDRSITALADYFGVARPSLSRALSEMAHDGIISIHHRKGTILNVNALKELVK